MSKKIIGPLSVLAGLIVAFSIFNRPEKIQSLEEPAKSSEILASVRVDHNTQAQVPKKAPGHESIPSGADENVKTEGANVDFDVTKQAEMKKLTTVAEEYSADKKTRVQIDCGDFHCNFLFKDLKADQSENILEYLKGKGSFYLSTVKAYQIIQDTNGMRLNVDFFRDSLQKDEENISEEDRLSEVKKQMDEVILKSPNLNDLAPAEYLKTYLKLFIDQSVSDSSLSDIAEYRIDCSTDKCEMNISFKAGTPQRNMDEHRDFVFLFIKQIAVGGKVKEYSVSSTGSVATYNFILRK